MSSTPGSQLGTEGGREEISFPAITMTVAFYAPLKPADHPVPSGDRQMARLLLRALDMAGFAPEIASDMQVYLKTGDGNLATLQDAARAETERLLSGYRSGELQTPGVWFTYHPYYKSPDLIGPQIARELAIPYVTAEASWSQKRASGRWADAHAFNEQGLRSAHLHLCLTMRDRAGLRELLGDEENLADFPPFIDVARIGRRRGEVNGSLRPVRLLTVAMMRQDVKLQSYAMLAEALDGLQDLDWHLDVVGDGEARGQVERAFAGIEQGRVTWHGELAQRRVFELYGQADIYVWPGYGEAFGLAYLEAQAAGLPVVAQNTKGIPSVVEHGRTGLLAKEGDLADFRAAIRRLIDNVELRTAMSRQAEKFVRGERSLKKAASRLKDLLGAFA